MLRLVLSAFFLLGFLFGRSCAQHPVTDFNKFLPPGEHAGALRFDDHDRQFIIFTPPGATADNPRPIVFFFHGAGGSAEQAAATYGWVEKAKAEHLFVVFPQGLPVRPNGKSSFLLNPNIWRDERPSLPNLVDDVHFFSTLLDKFETVLPIDQRQVFVTGFSNGAGMTFTLGAHFSDRIAAIAPVASQSWATVGPLARPLPVYYLVGTADPLIPYDGGPMKLGSISTQREMPPVAETVERWALLDGCPATPQTVSDRSGVRVLRYGPGRDDVEMLFTIVEGNGHHWPGSVEPLPPAISGPALDPFSATDRIWDFFRRHPLPKEPGT
jgi:polyhydroxybutyrate depolymerase